jgi:hypothetical protein
MWIRPVVHLFAGPMRPIFEISKMDSWTSEQVD